MVLVDSQIKARIDSEKLIASHDPDSVQNCRYNLRAGRAFAPETGEEVMLRKRKSLRKTPSFWSIKPSETLMIMTTEQVKMPSDLMATYGPLNHLAQKGLLLINSSIVEPGYEGNLSCFLLNFSNETVYIDENDAVAKICFFELMSVPDKVISVRLVSEPPNDGYAKSIARAAATFPKSFLGIGDIEKRISKSIGSSVKGSIVFGGVMITFLLLWATLEPILSKWIYDRTGVSTNSTTLDVTKLTQELKVATTELKHAQTSIPDAASQEALKRKNELLQSQIDSLKASVERLASKK